MSATAVLRRGGAGRPEVRALPVLLVLSALVVGGMAVVSPVKALALVVGVFFLLVTFRSLAAGVAIFTILTFFETLPVGAAAGVGVLKLAGGVLGIAWFLHVLARRGQTRLLWRDHPVIAYALIAFVAWAALSAAWSQSAGAAFGAAFGLAQNVVLVFIVYTALTQVRQTRWVLYCYVAGAFATAVTGIVQGNTAQQVGAYGFERLSGTIGDPNELAALLVPALVFAAFLLVLTKNPLARMGLVLSAVV